MGSREKAPVPEGARFFRVLQYQRSAMAPFALTTATRPAGRSARSNIFFKLLEERYRRRPTLITTDLDYD
jgi:hypothetical protein